MGFSARISVGFVVDPSRQVGLRAPFQRGQRRRFKHLNFGALRIEGSRTWNSTRSKGPRQYPEISNPVLEEYDHYDEVRVAGVITTPLTNYVVQEGWAYTLSWQIVKETSKVKGQEGYVDVYVSMEEGAKVSLNLPVISFSADVKTGIKRGQKVFNKDEVKNAVRNASGISQNFVLQRIMRNVKIYSQIGGYSNFEDGYVIERKDGGEPLGPFWPDYGSNGFPVNDSAFPKAKAAITAQMERSAIELAKQARQ